MLAETGRWWVRNNHGSNIYDVVNQIDAKEIIELLGNT